MGDASRVSTQPGRAAIESAIRSRAFRLVYQPIVHLDTGDLNGVEALCRCDDGTPADQWFAACEHYGLASQMDVAVLELALQDIDRLPAGYVAVNLSATTLAAAPPSLLATVAEAAQHRQLVLELTEHAAVEDYPATTASLTALRGAGVLFAVDDAGAGHSTFRHIIRLGPDIIKLDRSITEHIDGDALRRALVGAMVIFAGEIGAVVVAEGIETPGELATLRAAGVSRGQGYGLARPQRLPLAPLDYRPAPFLDLVARSEADEASSSASTIPRSLDPRQAAYRMRAVVASLANGVSLLRRSDGQMGGDEFRALCASLARQVGRVGEELEDVAAFAVGSSSAATSPSESSVD